MPGGDRVYFKDFRPAKRLPAESLTHWNTW
jgi:hypothetical protein